MSKETEKQILKLELKKKEKICAASERKLEKYQRANRRVANAISQEEIEDVILEIETQKLEIQILKTKIGDTNE